LKRTLRPRYFGAVTNPLKNKDLVRGAVAAVTILAACGKKPSGRRRPSHASIPAAGLAGNA